MNWTSTAIVASALSLAAPASAQSSPPALGYTQTPYGQPASSYAVPPLRPNTLRLSGGVAFVGAGYYCGYYSYYPGIYGTSCGTGYASTQPNVNLEVDIGLARTAALSVGANVFWGSFDRIDNTIWEPHLDYLARVGTSLDPIAGRFRIGAGLYVASVSGTSAAGNHYSSTNVGGAFRIGGGVSFFNDKVVGLGMDAVFEAGSISGNYVSTIQLLAGPELHF